MMNKKTNMDRRDFLKKMYSGALSGAALATFPGLSCSKGSPGNRYNVLFIAVDDLRPQLGCYGQPQMISPNIDRLASQGLLFERAYCQQAVCAPSRISLLSGLRPDSTGIYDLKHGLSKTLPNRISLPKLFKQKGYKTISLGKIYHHLNDDLQAWSQKPDWVTKPNGRYVTKEGLQLIEENRKINPEARNRGAPTEMADVPDNVYVDGKLTDRALKEMNRFKDKPFFLAVGYRKPHLPFTAPKKYWDLYDPQKIELAKNPFPPKGAARFAVNNFGELRGYYGMPKGKEPVSDEQARHLIHGYYACVSFIDAQVGRLLTELAALKLKEKTIVILWGDHGWKLGEHASWCKHTNFENDANAPLIISVPGMKTGGRKTKALIEFVDIYPTLCELCGLKLPDQPFDGCSFVPLLQNPGRSWKKAAFSQYSRGRVMGYTMRADRSRYTEWVLVETGKVLERELYDHEKDPQENINVVDDPKYTASVKRLEQMMKRGWKGALPVER